MEFYIPPYKVYVQTDENNRIITINSSAFLSDLTDWIEIDEGLAIYNALAEAYINGLNS